MLIKEVLIVFLVGCLSFIQCKFQPENVIHAINCGGDYFKDSFGIAYQSDDSEVGVASDFGKQFLIFGRVSQTDSTLYQTERYDTDTFGYDVPLEGDGSYVLILKFSEVYFNSVGSKVFDVVLNRHHFVVSRLDIYEKAGKAVAHDEYIPFSVKNGKFIVNDEDSDLEGNFFRMDLVKGSRDNPKINAFYLYKGDLEDVPKLPPLAVDEKPDEPIDEKEEEESSSSHEKILSGPRVADPYANDDSSLLLPIIIAIACAIPVTLCLWKLG